ncbi:MAG: PilZ domain-containing protein [Planctomycetota bacterium]|nr:PilZ domain-containing protein [Planctomycetota bacterium]
MKNHACLDAEGSNRILEMAIRSQSQATVDTPLADVPLNGALIAADGETLLIRLTGLPSFDPADLVGRECDVKLHDSQAYAFTCTVHGVPRWGQSIALAVSRPETVEVLERRRLGRAALAPSSEVTIEWRVRDAAHSHAATLLNISAGGLACRMDENTAREINDGSRVTLSFELPSSGPTFRLCAIVSNKTPASEDCVILGMEFLRSRDSKAQLEALGEIVKNPRCAMSLAGASA